ASMNAMAAPIVNIAILNIQRSDRNQYADGKVWGECRIVGAVTIKLNITNDEPIVPDDIEPMIIGSRFGFEDSCPPSSTTKNHQIARDILNTRKASPRPGHRSTLC